MNGGLSAITINTVEHTKVSIAAEVYGVEQAEAKLKVEPEIIGGITLLNIITI